jgi:nucleotide-binding universal stress UspA family protein
VDGSPASIAAVRAAADVGRREGATLDIVCAYGAAPGQGAEGLDRARTRARDGLAAAVRRAFGEDPPLRMRLLAVPGEAGEVLTWFSHSVDLLFVGDTAGAASGLGSTAQYCASHASCPVYVVPEQGQARAYPASEEQDPQVAAE